MARGSAPPERRTRDGRTTFERHLQSGLLTLATVGIIWLADSASSTKVTVGRMDERISAISVQVQQLSVRLSAIDEKNMDRSEADQRFKDVDRRLNSIEQELRPTLPPRGGR